MRLLDAGVTIESRLDVWGEMSGFWGSSDVTATLCLNIKAIGHRPAVADEVGL